MFEACLHIIYVVLFYDFTDQTQYTIHMGSKKHARVVKKLFKRKLPDTSLQSESDEEDQLNAVKK